MRSIVKIALTLTLVIFLNAANAATITAPINGETLTGDTVTLNIVATKNNSTGFHVFAGSFPGSTEYYDSQTTGVKQSPVVVTGLPVDGSPVSIRVVEVTKNGAWDFQDEISVMSFNDNAGTGGNGGGDTGGGNGETSLTINLETEGLQQLLVDFDTEVFAAVIGGGFLSFAVGVGGGLVYKAIVRGASW